MDNKSSENLISITATVQVEHHGVLICVIESDGGSHIISDDKILFPLQIKQPSILHVLHNRSQI